MSIAHLVQGSLLGAAVGDTLGMPLEMLSHQNVRTYYRGLREPVRDEKRGDLEKGQVTSRSQFLLLLGRSLIGDVPITELPELRRMDSSAGLPDGTAIVASTVFGTIAAVKKIPDDRLLESVIQNLARWVEKPETLAAGFGHARLVRDTILYKGDQLNGGQFLGDLAAALVPVESVLDADHSVSARLAGLQHVLDAFPLDLQDYCGGTGPAPDQAWPFAVAMFVRNPNLLEAGMLSAVNVGGDAPTVGACLGSLFGAFHGIDSFPAAWSSQLEITDEIIDLSMRIG